MKIMFFADVRLNAICAENLDLNQSRKWQVVRSERLTNFLDKAAQKNAAYVAIFGHMFGQDRVPESVIDGLFNTVKEEEYINVLVFLNNEEFKRISYRNDIPKNLHLFNMCTRDSYTDEKMALRIKDGVVELQLADNDTLEISKNEQEQFMICRMSDCYIIPSFEGIGFEDAEGKTCGYGILEWFDDTLGEFSITPAPKYHYQTIEIKISPNDDEKEIVRTIENVIRKTDFDTFLRVSITGKTAFGLTINGDRLKKLMQNKVFFVEVYDSTFMDINEETFANDISLRGEFVRLAMQDDSLSESERNRLISCGWNALNGREVTEE